MKTLIATLLFIGCAYASPKANYYIESVLQAPLQNELRFGGLSPAAVPNFYTEFEDKVAIIGKVKGRANYTNGQLTGLANAVRYTECQGPNYAFGVGRINCSIALDFVMTNYTGKVKYGKMPEFKVKATGNITRTVIFVNVTQSYNQAPQLSGFQVTQMGQVNPKFTGLGSALNKFLKVLENGYKAHVSAEYYNLLYQRFQFAFRQAVSRMPLPQP